MTRNGKVCVYVCFAVSILDEIIIFLLSTYSHQILDEWMGRSLIRSCAKLSYDHAQMMIEDQKGTTWGDAMPHVTSM